MKLILFINIVKDNTIHKLLKGLLRLQFTTNIKLAKGFEGMTPSR